MNTVQQHLKNIGACADAIKWSYRYKTWEDLAKNCTNPEWSMWLIQKTNALDDKELRLLACAFVRHTPAKDGVVWDLLTDERSRNAVRVAERYANGLASKQERDAARVAAWDAARDAAGAAAWDAVWAAAGVARAAARAAAADAADAAGVARDAARAAAWDAARAAAEEWQVRYIYRKHGRDIVKKLNSALPISK